MSVGGVASELTTPPGGRNHSQPGMKTIRCINWKIMTKRKADGNENAKKTVLRGVERKCMGGIRGGWW